MHAVCDRHSQVWRLQDTEKGLVLCWLEQQCVEEGRSLLPAAGTAVTKSLQGQMNCLATAELTLERRSLCVLCVTGAS